MIKHLMEGLVRDVVLSVIGDEAEHLTLSIAPMLDAFWRSWGHFHDFLLTIGRIDMPIATLDRKTINVRFQTNMKRIGAITTFLHSGAENLTPTGFLRSEGVRADILRAVLVFLHAAIEDFVRSHLPRPNKHFTLSSEADIKRALSRLNID